jgi:hypothetical protein
MDVNGPAIITLVNTYGLLPFLNATDLNSNVGLIDLVARYNDKSDVNAIIGQGEYVFVKKDKPVWMVMPTMSLLSEEDSNGNDIVNAFEEMKKKFIDVYGNKGVIIEHDITNDFNAHAIVTKLIAGRYATEPIA